MSNQKEKVVKKKNSNNLKKENEMVISPKNYFYAVVIFIGVIAVALYLFAWYQVKKEERLMNSYLVSSNTIMSSVNDLTSLTQVMQEAPTSYFIYVSYCNDEDVYNLEKDLKKTIDKYKLNDIFYYVDITDLKNNDKDYLNKIKETLNIEELKSVPAVIYVDNGQIKNENILDGVKNSKFKVADLQNLLDIYEFEVIK